MYMTVSVHHQNSNSICTKAPTFWNFSGRGGCTVIDGSRRSQSNRWQTSHYLFYIFNEDNGISENFQSGTCPFTISVHSQRLWYMHKFRWCYWHNNNLRSFPVPINIENQSVQQSDSHLWRAHSRDVNFSWGIWNYIFF